jgi:hypothetical protein
VGLVDDDRADGLKRLEVGVDARGGVPVLFSPPADLVQEGGGEVIVGWPVSAGADLEGGTVAVRLSGFGGADGEIGEGTGFAGDRGTAPAERRGSQAGIDGLLAGDDAAESGGGSGQPQIEVLERLAGSDHGA